MTRDRLWDVSALSDMILKGTLDSQLTPITESHEVK